MTHPDTPKDGDFASYLQAREKAPSALPADPLRDLATDLGAPAQQTIEQVVVDGEEPTDELIEEWKAFNAAPELTDEELERQALEAPGDDGDPRTPE